ncbi:MAG: DnaD domain protein [Eubacteriales bacterium]|nr:DnaD domain protein [Eubacteriales bacterium]
MSYNDLIQVDATLVANKFLDKYMPSANGDYVKVYLYLLRNRINGIDVETIAEKLELTEGDVRRAIKYWEKCGILSIGSSGTEAGNAESGALEAAPADPSDKAKNREETAQTLPVSADTGKGIDNTGNGVDDTGEIRNRYKRADGKEALNRLSSDDEFRQLLFIVQKYRSKILTDSEEQVLAYLYDGLKLPCDVLDFLVQYCVESNHNSMRYIEKTGLDWANLGIKTVKDAKERTREFDKARAESGKKRSARADKAGITRGNDLDQWLRQEVQRNIQ